MIGPVSPSTPPAWDEEILYQGGVLPRIILSINTGPERLHYTKGAGWLPIPIPGSLSSRSATTGNGRNRSGVWYVTLGLVEPSLSLSAYSLYGTTVLAE